MCCEGRVEPHTPAGVVFTHARLAHSTHFFAEQCGVGEGTRVLQKTSNVWSVFRHEVFPALCRKGAGLGQYRSPNPSVIPKP